MGHGTLDFECGGGLDEADAEVVARLFNAAWREGFAETRRVVPGLRDGAAWAVVRLPGGVELAAACTGVGTLDWPRPGPPYHVRRAGGDPEPLVCAAQAAALFDDGGPGAAALREESASSRDNLALIFEGVRERSARVRESGLGLVAYAHSGADLGGARPEEWLESWVLRGHPFHPGCKARAGFSPEDLRRYSPEFAPTVPIRFVAVRREFVVERRVPGTDDRWPLSWTRQAEAELHSRGLVPGGYAVFPCHPWQFERVIPAAFRSLLASRSIVTLGLTVPARPLASLRTMVPSGFPGACHLKLPVAIQATSAQRTVSAASAQNGPAFTERIERARRSLPWTELWELQGEERGAHWWNPAAAPTDAAALETARHLSFLCRRPPRRVAGETLVPAVVLPERSPADGLPVAAELADSCPGGPGGFFSSYAAVTLRSLLPLALAEGIALEAHAQNTLVALRDGRPSGCVFRDLGGLRVLEEWASSPDPVLHPATLIRAASPAELAQKLLHTWLNNGLAPLARALSDGCGLAEEGLWASARREVRSVFHELRPRHAAARLAPFEAEFFAPTVRVKALTRMRLSRKYFQYDLAEVGNPLHGA